MLKITTVKYRPLLVTFAMPSWIKDKVNKQPEDV
jgi:hypothetical protein